MNTFDEMAQHIENLQRASRNLLHAVIDDGCNCETEPVYTRGKYDYKAAAARDNQYNVDGHYYWGLHNPHTRWGFDVTLAVAVLSGTPHAFDAIDADVDLVAKHAWAHMPLAEVAMGEEVRLAGEIEQLESALRDLLEAHASARDGEIGMNLHRAPVTQRLRQLLADTEYSYG